MVKPTLVSNTIRAHRERAGLTQAELARTIGVTRQTLIAIEQQKYSPTLELAFQIARAFGVGIDDLFAYPADPGGAV
ncbi:helix-turn-helix transcriptional regulator [Microbacterium sp.]|uniref:helix-turn-helix transcriptional regulator n=1 Tax=Microbacterium sp. TaxID=51671 RepID=UPI00289F395C|nr:helix-turn-helix transcriptional regulator [Microbacterium sp.]